MNLTTETIVKAEQAVEKSASKQAYQVTDHIKDPVLQKQTYTLVRGSIIIGARIMQEELMKLNN